MLHFECDYTGGATEAVLNALVRTNNEQTTGYGEDEHCLNAKKIIKQKCAMDTAEVHFVVGGTQANLTVIAAGLRPFEGVLCADSGHINVHETGAIEATGHKVLALAQSKGKISADQVRDAVMAHHADASHEHMVRPGMVYISHPTEVGTLYTRTELEALSAACRELGLLLYIDGARLGYGLAADTQVDMPLLAKCADAFTIGGTKVGLLFGEAIVLTSDRLKDCFRYHIKQRGGMLAKGRLLGVQFEAMLAGNDYVTLSKTANEWAQEIKQAFVAHGCPLLIDTPANQIFPILSQLQMDTLCENYVFSFWERVDDERAAVRFCTSVLTQREQVDALLNDIAKMPRN